MKQIGTYKVIKETTTYLTQVERWSDLLENVKRGYSKVIWVIDRKLIPIIPVQKLENLIELDGGDSVKSIEIFNELIHQFSNYNLDRKGHVVAIGGGSISDLVGFAASVYLRGVSFSIIPSTLLSLIDASMGGKNGINFRHRKNQIGTIYQPSTIYFLPEIIQKLPPEEMADGFAEIIKYGLILDWDLFEKLRLSNLGAIKENSEVLQEIIFSCIIHKSTIVKEDPFEDNKRRILNFGHTIGHAIESLYEYSHGSSVGLGMLFAAKMSESYYGLDTSISNSIIQILAQYKLPIKLENFSAEAIFEKIMADKKREDEGIYFIFIREIGKAKIEKITMEVLRRYLIKAEQERWISL